MVINYKGMCDKYIHSLIDDSLYKPLCRARIIVDINHYTFLILATNIPPQRLIEGLNLIVPSRVPCKITVIIISLGDNGVY